tara:strand:+ start:339 stop:500 length:162 start_codon:yes stop_codon:yes gene_type:complete
VKKNKLTELNPARRGVKTLTGIKPYKLDTYRIAQENANIQRVDAQVKKYFKKK